MVQHVPALFPADTLSLGFLNSIATPLDGEIDWIEDGEAPGPAPRTGRPPVAGATEPAAGTLTFVDRA